MTQRFSKPQSVKYEYLSGNKQIDKGSFNLAKRIAEITLAQQQSKTLDKCQKEFAQIKNQVTESSLKLQDFYELRSIKAKVQDIDRKHLEKVQQVNKNIDEIEIGYSEVMTKLKRQSTCLSQQISKLANQKSQKIISSLAEKDNQLSQLSKLSEASKQQTLAQIQLKSKTLKKQIAHTAKQLNSGQILMRSKFKSIKRNILRTLQSENERREQFGNHVYQTLSEISAKVQARIKTAQRQS